MFLSIVLLGSVSLPARPALETRFAQVAPDHRTADDLKRTDGCKRAVVLMHGLRPHPFSRKNAARAEWQGWQQPGSALVKRLGADADVYSFSYGQNDRLETIAAGEDLREALRQVKKLGYDDLVLVTHSAGGLLARYLVEDCPDVGVTKVIQVGCPNGGSFLADFSCGVRKDQEPFLESLTKQHRQRCLERRADKGLPAGVEFVCVVCQAKLEKPARVSLGDWELKISPTTFSGDGVVSCVSQWPEDLQKQGVPAVVIHAWHHTAMRDEAAIEIIARLVNDKQARWSADQVAETRRKIFGADQDR